MVTNGFDQTPATWLSREEQDITALAGIRNKRDRLLMAGSLSAEVMVLLSVYCGPFAGGHLTVPEVDDLAREGENEARPESPRQLAELEPV